MKNKIWSFLKKLKLELPYDLAILLLGIYPNKMTSLPQVAMCTPVFAEALFTLAKMWKQPKYLSADD